MSNSRYVLNKPILVVGLLVENENGISFPPSVNSYFLSKQMSGLSTKKVDWDTSDLKFKIIQINPESEHEVNIEYSDNKGIGYIGSTTDIDLSKNCSNGLKTLLPTLKPILRNQYPEASYSQTSTESDWYWILDFEEMPLGIIDLLKINKLPHRFQDIERFLDDIQYGIKNAGEESEPLIEALSNIYKKVIDEITNSFPDWNIEYTKCRYLDYQKVSITKKENTL